MDYMDGEGITRRGLAAVAANLLCLVLLPQAEAFAPFSLASASFTSTCASAPVYVFGRGQHPSISAVPPSFKRTLCQRQGRLAPRMGVLRVITPEEIPVDCSEPVDPKALETAKAVIKSIR